MVKKFILTLALCCTLSAVSNANWLSILFSRFVTAWDEDGACFECAEYGTRCDECNDYKREH